MGNIYKNECFCSTIKKGKGLVLVLLKADGCVNSGLKVEMVKKRSVDEGETARWQNFFIGKRESI